MEDVKLIWIAAPTATAVCRLLQRLASCATVDIIWLPAIVHALPVFCLVSPAYKVPQHLPSTVSPVLTAISWMAHNVPCVKTVHTTSAPSAIAIIAQFTVKLVWWLAASHANLTFLLFRHTLGFARIFVGMAMWWLFLATAARVFLMTAVLIIAPFSPITAARTLALQTPFPILLPQFPLPSAHICYSPVSHSIRPHNRFMPIASH